jgi:ClpX C4-type zinc finger protein
MTDPAHCSFCGRLRGDVRFLMTGPSVAICGECVAFAVSEMVKGAGLDKYVDVLVEKADAPSYTFTTEGVPAALPGGEFVDLKGKP